MAFEATMTTLIRADNHPPLWLVTGTDNGRPAARLTHRDGSYIEVTPEQKQQLEIAFIDAEQQAARMKMEAIVAIFGDDVFNPPGSSASTGSGSSAHLAPPGTQFFALEPGVGLIELPHRPPDD
ncbi:hypothetical protein [Nocardia transvalensis]|uniref:hypothetical protein n=1 Tax=Nocardia transvalensis TaxID=37333 RepID=UPI001893E1E7|nr:hypothetical protein [Nocardia transvalensis]MBF6332484.1 hypothetical protein [Nocardia transvalensis]